MNLPPALIGRRTLAKLIGSAALVAAGACRRSPGPNDDAEAAPALADPLYLSSTTALAAAIRQARVSSEEVVQTFLIRIEQVNPALNAVVQLRADGARADARRADEALSRGESWGPLHGVPMTIKDSLDTVDLITTGGIPARAKFTPRQDATVVRRLREAGAILLGKTNTPQLTLSFETNNEIYGRTNNPWNTAYTSGGSSGGAAAIVAAGGAPFDIGSDYAGSIRLPAHFNGIAGLKPSSGRVPRTGHVIPFDGVQDSFQQIGPLARYVEDLALLLPIIAGPDGVDPAIVPMPLGDPRDVDVAMLRVGFHVDNGIRTPTAEVQSVVRSAADALAKAGARVDESRPQDVERSFEIGFGLFGSDGGAMTRRLLREAGTPEADLPEPTAALSAEERDALVSEWYTFRSRMLAYFDDHDVILCPANAKPAVPHGTIDLPDFGYTTSYNMTGWPAVVVRGGTSPEGLPIGVQVVAPPAREDIALAVAAHLETALGGFKAPSL